VVVMGGKRNGYGSSGQGSDKGRELSLTTAVGLATHNVMGSRKSGWAEYAPLRQCGGEGEGQWRPLHCRLTTMGLKVARPRAGVVCRVPHGVYTAGLLKYSII
jgi:hypothetical protein